MIAAGQPAASDASVLLVIDEQTQIGGARRASVALAHAHGMGTEAVGRLAIVVTEAATNILRHAARGVVVLRALGEGPNAAIEILALDKGPGMADVERAMRDGYSTSGTAGQGLGGIRRLSQLFGMYSQRGQGTALVARVGEASAPLGAQDIGPGSRLEDRLGVVSVPMRGESECGDAWRVTVSRGHTSVMLVDGLGHGPHAASAAAIATATFSQLATDTPDAALAKIDAAMRGSRGAALSIAVVDDATGAMRFSGVGNVDGRMVTNGASTHFVPQNGIVGHTMPTLQSIAGTWASGGRLVMHSDGISARWRMESYPGLLAAHPALLAGVLYRDFARDRDDATVIVLGARPREEL